MISPESDPSTLPFAQGSAHGDGRGSHPARTSKAQRRHRAAGHGDSAHPRPATASRRPGGGCPPGKSLSRSRGRYQPHPATHFSAGSRRHPPPPHHPHPGPGDSSPSYLDNAGLGTAHAPPARAGLTSHTCLSAGREGGREGERAACQPPPSRTIVQHRLIRPAAPPRSLLLFLRPASLLPPRACRWVPAPGATHTPRQRRPARPGPQSSCPPPGAVPGASLRSPGSLTPSSTCSIAALLCQSHEDITAHNPAHHTSGVKNEKNQRVHLCPLSSGLVPSHQLLTSTIKAFSPLA